jgi:hypothetical protein
MRKILTLSLLSVAALAFVPAIASAQSGTTSGAVGGAITGAIVGGPVGAVVGGVIGAIIGTAITPPPVQVVTYVTTVETPPAVTLQGNLVLGATLPSNVQLYPIPNNVYTPTPTATYAYAYINGHKVVVDTQTRAVVAIIS